MLVEVVIAFIAGLVVGACAGAFALAVVTERCYCYPEDDK